MWAVKKKQGGNTSDTVEKTKKPIGCRVAVIEELERLELTKEDMSTIMDMGKDRFWEWLVNDIMAKRMANGEEAEEFGTTIILREEPLHVRAIDELDLRRARRREKESV